MDSLTDGMRHHGQSTTPLVTVVIPAFNAGRFIAETLDSVFAQSMPDIEVIVVDDGSTDETARIVSAATDPRLTVLSQTNQGVSAARNTGLAVATAPYVFFLDADDVLMPDALEHMVARLGSMPDRVACYAHHIRIAEDGSVLSGRGDLRWKLFPANDTLRHLVAKNFIVCGAICIRTEAARAVRGFDPRLRLGEDWEFWYRLAVIGDFAAIPDVIVLKYRQRFVSANYRLRPTSQFQNAEAIELVFSNPAIRAQFDPGRLKRLRRYAEIDAFWAGARNAYVQDHALSFF